MLNEEPCHLCGKTRQSYVEMEVGGLRKSICERCYKTKVAVPREPYDGDGESEDTLKPQSSLSAEELRRRALQTIPPTPATRRAEEMARQSIGGAPAGASGSASDAAPVRGLPRRSDSPSSDDISLACKSCGTGLSQDDAFCHSCGEPATSFCGKCGSRMSAGDRFCPGCGAKV